MEAKKMSSGLDEECANPEPSLSEASAYLHYFECHAEMAR